MDKKKLIIAASVAGAIIIALVVANIVTRNQMTEMEEVLTEEKMTLMEEYQTLYSDFDSLRNNNSELEQKLLLERERVAQLQEELRITKTTNARRIKELQAELTTMRGVMRSFIVQIDSLNQRNQELTRENREAKRQIHQAKLLTKELEDQNKELSGVVATAARLSARDITAQALTNKEKATNKYKNTAKIKVDFNIEKNVTAQNGLRRVYLRIERPDGNLLMHSRSDTFPFEDTQLVYSAATEVEYGGSETKAYIVYTVDEGELMAGDYRVELFCEGDKLGAGGGFKLK